MDRQSRLRILGSFRRRIFGTLLLKNTVTLAAVLLLCWGIVVLAMRVGGFENRLHFAFGLLGLFLMPPIAWLWTRRRVPDEQRLASILDRNNNAGGLLMASFETELGAWSERIETLEVPKIRWRPQRTLALVGVSLVFAVAALFFPLSVVSGSNSHRLNIDDQVKRLTTQLDVMEEEKLLEVEEVESRKLDLRKIQKEADGLGPVKTFDALDHIADQMSQRAKEAVEDAQKMTEQMAEAMALSQKVKEIHGKLDDKTAKSLMDGLAQSLEEMFAANEKLAEDVKKTLAEQAEKKKKEGEDGKDGKDGEKNEAGAEKEKNDALVESLKKMMEEKNMEGMTPDMIDQLCEAMQQCQGDCERMCENLQNAGFPVDKEMLEKLAESKNVEKTEAERMLSELWAQCDGCGGEPGDCEGGEEENHSPRYSQKQDWRTDPNAPPGKNRFEKEPDEEGAEFKAKYLPPSDLEAFKNSLKIGASTSAPEFDPAGTGGDHGGAIRDTGGGSGNAHSRTIYPQHRGAVGRYFEK